MKDGYPKGLIDLTRMTKAGDGISIEPGRKFWYVPERAKGATEQCRLCGTEDYTEQGLCEDCFIEHGLDEDEWEFENNA